MAIVDSMAEGAWSPPGGSPLARALYAAKQRAAAISFLKKDPHGPCTIFKQLKWYTKDYYLDRWPMPDDFEEARERMVNNQLIPRGISDPLVLRAMRRVPRERFVPRELLDSAYGDYPLPIGEQQTISQPYIVAHMTESLALTGDEKILEIGTGSGYQAAVLADICKEVYTVERIGTLSERARQILDQLGYRNIFFKVHNGSHGWPEHAPFDAILVTAAAPAVPGPYLEQLKDGGRIIIPVGDRFSQNLIRITKKGDEIIREDIGGVRFVSLVGEHGWKE